MRRAIVALAALALAACGCPTPCNCNVPDPDAGGMAAPQYAPCDWRPDAGAADAGVSE